MALSTTMCKISEMARLKRTFGHRKKGYIRYAVYLAYGKFNVAAPSYNSSEFDLVE